MNIGKTLFAQLMDFLQQRHSQQPTESIRGLTGQ